MNETKYNYDWLTAANPSWLCPKVNDAWEETNSRIFII